MAFISERRWVVKLQAGAHPDEVVLPLPPDLCGTLGWEVGDEIQVDDVTDGKICRLRLRKLSEPTIGVFVSAAQTIADAYKSDEK